MGTHLLVVFGMLFSSIILAAVLVFLIPEKRRKQYSEKIIWGLIMFSGFLIIYSFWAVDIEKDSIKGNIEIMNPIISIAGVIVTGLAFFMQYRANLQVQNQFRIQQFESQYYEMLKLHKENVIELEATIVRTNEKVLGRAVFSVMRNELHTLLDIASQFNRTLSIEDYLECYNIYFWGYNGFGDFKSFNINDLTIADWKNNSPVRVSLYTGYSDKLGHYYRHLYQMVKFVAKEKSIEEKQKKKYLKMLRAQLSNNEQMMLFYNWLAKGYGDAWEENVETLKVEEKKNYFFTRYRMIHNLWHDELFDNEFFHEAVRKLERKYEVVRLDDSALFENEPNFDS